MVRQQDDGSYIEIGALFGYCSAILKIMVKFRRAMYVAACDSSRKTFRTEIYEGYKASRKSMPPELFTQLSLIQDACHNFGFKTEKIPGFEADDIIASYTKYLGLQPGYEVIVISSDKDLMQLLGCPQYRSKVRIYDPMKHKEINEDDVIDKFGVPPGMVLDVMALMGDNSDDIPGVPGIGPKTAASLIKEYKTLDNLIENLDALPKSKKNDTLRRDIDKAILSKKLAALKDDIDINFQYIESPDNMISQFLEQYGFQSLLKYVEKIEEM